jgi:succinoglycan biosynthesis protein ExoM
MSMCREIRTAICISTYRRQGLLRDLLDGVAKLTFHKVAAPEVVIIVVDTPDEYGSAQEICRSVSLPWALKYVIEPRRGLTYARNRAISEANGVDFIAFVDDDEIPSCGWLDELLWTQAEFRADVVSGPVVAQYSPSVADWIRAGGFHNSPFQPTGTQCITAATHNVLVGTHVLQTVPAFDDTFALSGAEDTDFFLRVAQAGYKIVWCQNAIVFEHISAKRATLRWILRREYQTGNGWVFCEAIINTHVRDRIFRLFKACGHVAMGLASAIWSSLRLDRIALVRSLRRVTMGAGMLTALAGHKYLAYEQVDLEV